jgi:hypothetical protein
VRIPARLLSAARWLVVLVPLADLALVLAGVLDPRTGLLVGLALEALLALVVLVELRVFRAAYRRGRVAGRTRSEAVVLGLEAVWPPVVLRLARAEIGLFRALAWAARGRRSVAPGEIPLSYGDRFTVVLWGICGLGALELGVVHVLTAPWPVLQWTLFVLGVYAFLWVLGLGLSLRQHPHLLRDGELVLRFGHLRSLSLPLDRLAAVRTGAVAGHARNLVLDDEAVVMAVMGDTNVELRFEPPVDVVVAGRSRPVARVSFYADDPRTTARLLRDGDRDPTPKS